MLARESLVTYMKYKADDHLLLRIEFLYLVHQIEARLDTKDRLPSIQSKSDELQKKIDINF
jgi:hypothetical protein